MSSDVSNRVRTCKYCLSDENQDDLIWPCRCKTEGYATFVHRDCLNHWRVSCQRKEHFFACRECEFEFRLEEFREEGTGGSFVQRSLRNQRQRFRWIIGKSMRNFVACAILMQLCICSLAILLRFIDRHEWLVKFWRLPQNPHGPKPGKGTLLESLQYHKLTYYLSAVVLIGFASLVVLCFMMCCWCECEECAGRAFCTCYCLASLTMGQALPCCGFFLGLVAVGAMTLLFLGSIGVAVVAVIMFQRMIQACMQSLEIRHLATWYQVKDRAAGLSAEELPPNADPPEEEVNERLKRLVEFHYNTTHGIDEPTADLGSFTGRNLLELRPAP